MSQYRTFTAADAVEYAKTFGGMDDPSVLSSAEEIGDGNLNLVFKIYDNRGKSRVVVKQALPYVRCVGESWPLTWIVRVSKRKRWLSTTNIAPSTRLRLRITMRIWR